MKVAQGDIFCEALDNGNNGWSWNAEDGCTGLRNCCGFAGRVAIVNVLSIYGCPPIDFQDECTVLLARGIESDSLFDASPSARSE